MSSVTLGESTSRWVEVMEKPQYVEPVDIPNSPGGSMPQGNGAHAESREQKSLDQGLRSSAVNR